MKNPYDVIKSARITEKSTVMSESSNCYVFEVDRKATKLDVAHAIQTIFKKKVKSVNTMNVRGKKKRLRTAQYGRSAHWKKAIVTLHDGETIDLV
ncbi:MAG: 50S ribosomal protein L23 [Verrucomicrobiota bacterium]